MNEQPTKTETMNGGAEIGVTLLNGSTAKLFVKQLPARRMTDFLNAQNDEVAMIDLACSLDGKPVKADIVDGLTEESHTAVIAEIERINGDFFLKWGKRQAERASRLKANFLPANP
jgi:hypothetical protein